MKFMRGLGRLSTSIFLLLLLNILITLSAFILTNIICAFLGISIQDSGFLFYIVFYSIIGFGGAFISLQFSIPFAKRAFRIQVLKKQNASSEQLKIINWVENCARKAGISNPPQVGIYESPEVNAFATGPRKNKSLVALSTGLLNQMDDSEIEGVIGHEVAHIANGDMVTMTLLMGLVNTMVLILARIAATAITSAMRRRSWFLEYMIFNLFYILFSMIGAVCILRPFSRRREYKADRGGAYLSGKEKMIKALRKLQTIHLTPQIQESNAQYNIFKISTGSKKQSFIQTLFSTHPSLDSRIKRLQRSAMISSF